MATPLDTIEVLIQADVRGLEGQLKRAGSLIDDFVSGAGTKEINWKNIFTKSLTPAVVAGIAAVLANTIVNAMQMQTAIVTSSQQSGTAFGNTTQDMTNNALDMAAKTGASATDIATAMGVVGQTFKDTATAQAVLNTVTEEAYIKGTSVTDMAKTLVPLFESWNVSGADTAGVMATLNDAVKDGKIPFDTLIQNLTTVGPALSKITDLSKTASGVELFTTMPGVTAATALNELAVAADGAQHKLAPINLLVADMGKAIQTGGIIQAFKDITDGVKRYGNVAPDVLKQTGLDLNTMSAAASLTNTEFSKLQTALDTFLAKNRSLDQQKIESTTAQKELTSAWNEFNTALQKDVAPTLIGLLTSAIKTATAATDELGQGFDGILADLKLMATGDFWKSLGQNLEPIAKVLAPIGNVATVGGANNVGTLLGTMGYQIATGGDSKLRAQQDADYQEFLAVKAQHASQPQNPAPSSQQNINTIHNTVTVNDTSGNGGVQGSKIIGALGTLFGQIFK